jgi:pimeloyl-ACP methyl ester carboxylesterase
VRTRFFSLPFVGRIAAELVVVPIGLLIAPMTIGAIFDPDPVPAGFSARIGALLAIRPGTFVSSARDVVDFHDCLVHLSPHYNEIAVPTEIVTGEMDLVVSPVIHAHGLARDIPGARLTVMPGVGHLPQWSRTSDVVAAIERTRARMAKVRRLGRTVHFEDAHVRDRFGIEDARGKLNGDRAL